jgi:hypothetical protein
MGLLVFVWVLMVLFLTRTPEKELHKRQLIIPTDDARVFDFPSLPTGTHINVTFEGAFLPKVHEIQGKSKSSRFKDADSNIEEDENYLKVFLRANTSELMTSHRIYAISAPQYFDTANITRFSVLFDIGEDNYEFLLNGNRGLQIVMQTYFTKIRDDDKQEMPLILSYDIDPINRQIGVIFASFVLFFLYAMIIYEVSRSNQIFKALTDLT